MNSSASEYDLIRRQSLYRGAMINIVNFVRFSINLETDLWKCPRGIDYLDLVSCGEETLLPKCGQHHSLEWDPGCIKIKTIASSARVLTSLCLSPSYNTCFMPLTP